MEAAQEVFEVIRAGDATRLAALLAADRSLANARNERGHSTVLIAQYHQKRDLVTMLLAAGPELDIFDAASVGIPPWSTPIRATASSRSPWPRSSGFPRPCGSCSPGARTRHRWPGIP